MLFIIPSWGRASRKHLISMISSIDPFYIIHDILEGPLWAWKPLGSHLREGNIPGHGYSQTPDCDTLSSCWSQKFVQAWSLWRAGHQASWPYRPASIISEEIQYSRLGRRGRNKRSKAKTRMDISVKEVWRKILWIERKKGGGKCCCELRERGKELIWWRSEEFLILSN